MSHEPNYITALLTGRRTHVRFCGTVKAPLTAVGHRDPTPNGVGFLFCPPACLNPFKKTNATR